jgi:hypothetical protein
VLENLHFQTRPAPRLLHIFQHFGAPPGDCGRENPDRTRFGAGSISVSTLRTRLPPRDDGTNMRRMILIATLLGTSPADACRICFPLPRNSLADHLIEANDVLLAREDPGRRFHLKAIRILKGSKPDERLELFLDSGTRRILAANSTRSVLLARKDEWRRLATMDEVLLPVVEAILRQAPSWKGGDRFDFFSRYFEHDHPALRDLAHLEVARAPYVDLRRFGRRVPMEKVRAALRDARYAEWWALHILLLGQSDDPRDQKAIRERVHSMVRIDHPLHLGAWATALVEIDGTEAIEFLESRYFRRARRNEDIREVVLALSVQGKVGRRDRIVAAYRVLLEKHPALASAVLDDLIAWRRRDMVAYMEAFGKKHARALMPDARLKLRRFTSIGG